jgi:hypothetical protein
MRKLSEEELIKRFNNIHNGKFDYSLMNYKDINSKIKIICPIHGEFEQTVKNHLHGNDCFECSKRKKSKTTKEFIEQAEIIHNNFYDYSLTIYKNYLNKVKIICPIHGEFEELPTEHLFKKSGCKKCGIEKTKKFTLLGLDKFIEKANKIHYNKYDYSKVIYINSYSKVEIICPEHGSFFQKPGDHIHSKAGCPVCKESKGEALVAFILQSFNIDFDRQKSFSDLKHKRLLYYDFYLPELNMCIEYDGEQHFKPVLNWGGDELFKELQLKDKLKNEYCKKHNIPLLRLTYKDSDEDVRSKILNFLGIKEKLIIRFSEFKK